MLYNINTSNRVTVELHYWELYKGC